MYLLSISRSVSFVFMLCFRWRPRNPPCLSPTRWIPARSGMGCEMRRSSLLENSHIGVVLTGTDQKLSLACMAPREATRLPECECRHQRDWHCPSLYPHFQLSIGGDREENRKN